MEHDLPAARPIVTESRRRSTISILVRLGEALALFTFGAEACAMSQAPQAAPRAVLISALDALQIGDEPAFKRRLTNDFVAIDGGERFTEAKLWGAIQSLRREGRRPYWHVQDFVSHREGRIMWADYRNVGGMVWNNHRAPKIWLESVVFRQKNGYWQIALLHSSPVAAH